VHHSSGKTLAEVRGRSPTIEEVALRESVAVVELDDRQIGVAPTARAGQIFPIEDAANTEGPDFWSRLGSSATWCGSRSTRPNPYQRPAVSASEEGSCDDAST